MFPRRVPPRDIACAAGALGGRGQIGAGTWHASEVETVEPTGEEKFHLFPFRSRFVADAVQRLLAFAERSNWPQPPKRVIADDPSEPLVADHHRPIGKLGGDELMRQRALQHRKIGRMLVGMARHEGAHGGGRGVVLQDAHQRIDEYAHTIAAGTVEKDGR